MAFDDDIDVDVAAVAVVVVVANVATDLRDEFIAAFFLLLLVMVYITT